MKNMSTKSQSRRNFLQKAAVGSMGVTLSSSLNSLSAKNYRNIIGANDRINVAIAGLGRRLGSYVPPITHKDNNVRLVYLCDVMVSQREKAQKRFGEKLDYQPQLENDIRKVLADKEVNAIFNATPDHWHAPMAFMAMEAGKDMYLEKPVSHNPHESEMLVDYQKNYGSVIQMGTQQRSSPESIEVVGKIHDGLIGEVYKAKAFYSSGRGEVVVPQKAEVPVGLDWELFQGPAPRKPYEHNTWDYNWHWYGWDYGTAESGNNGTHELDVARWAMQVDHPQHVMVQGAKRHFKDDGWTMYDTIDATFIFPGNKVIEWDGKSRNAYKTYGHGRGTIIYGTDGTVFIDRNGYKVFDRSGELLQSGEAEGKESGLALGGGGDMSTRHVTNFFETIRGKEKLNQPIDQGVVSQHLTHLINIAYRANKPLEVDTTTGRVFDRDAMKIWGREYEPGWEPKAV